MGYFFVLLHKNKYMELFVKIFCDSVFRQTTGCFVIKMMKQVLKYFNKYFYGNL